MYSAHELRMYCAHVLRMYCAHVQCSCTMLIYCAHVLCSCTTVLMYCTHVYCAHVQCSDTVLMCCAHVHCAQVLMYCAHVLLCSCAVLMYCAYVLCSCTVLMYYARWLVTAFRDTTGASSAPRVDIAFPTTDKDLLLKELALYFLIYTEAANLREMPGVLWFVFHCLRNSTRFKQVRSAHQSMLLSTSQHSTPLAQHTMKLVFPLPQEQQLVEAGTVVSTVQHAQHRTGCVPWHAQHRAGCVP
jgi:1,3-beta-glucan synthase subunit FKS1, domain-1